MKIPMPSGIPRLLLFDIDGTLTKPSHKCLQVVVRSLSIAFSHNITDKGLNFPETTTPKLMKLLLHANGITPHTCKDYDEKIEKTLAVLPGVMSNMIVRREYRPRALPHAVEFISKLSECSDVRIALLTDDLEIMAKIKLSAAGFDLSHFTTSSLDRDQETSKLMGAFGSDHTDRNELFKIALSKYSKSVNKRVLLEDFVVIGDAPRDITFAHNNGLVSFCVASGYYGKADLQDADHTVKNFQNYEKCKQILVDPSFVH